jgi:eukaryotic-like serine/threonine-protein kinase
VRPQRSDSLIGKIVGSYDVESLLGSGGMGEVYRARDTRLDRIVAVKVLPRNVADDPEHMVRLEREARLLASVK